MRFLGGWGVPFLVLMGTLTVPTAVAQDAPHNPSDIIQPIFEQVVWVSVVIGVFVWGLLIYAIIRFRRRRDGPSEGVQTHGNTKLEIAWTIAPALVLAWLLVISYNGLIAIDGPGQPEPDFTIEAIGSQWQWTFVYPDGKEVKDEFRVQEDVTVGVLVKSVDVNHAFAIADFGVLVDALPGHTNYVWFHPKEPGEHRVQCLQFCGAAHGDMRANIVVFAAGTQPDPWGDPPAAPAPGGGAPSGPQEPAPEQEPRPEVVDRTVQVNLVDFRFEHPELETFRIEPGETVEFAIRNDDPTVHNLFVGTYAKKGAAERVVVKASPDLGQAQAASIFLTFEEGGVFDVWCDIAGHADISGMRTKLGVGDDPPANVESLENPRLPGPGLAALLGGIALTWAWRRRA